MNYEQEADSILEEMRGGDIFDVSPDRTRRIIADALRKAASGDRKADIVGGPIEMRGYDYLTIVVDHDAVMPDGSTRKIPAGTKLVMRSSGGGPGVTYDRGLAAKVAVPPISGI